MSSVREQLVARAMSEPVRSLRRLSGGSISDVFQVESGDGRRLVAKFARPGLLEEEMEGLEALRGTNTVRVPEVHVLHVEDQAAVLLMEELPVGGDPDWAAFGRTLASLHQAPAGDRYGFTRDNHLGTTPQCNRWMEDWPRFNREQRHGPLVEAIASGGGLCGSDLGLVLKTLDAFEAVLPRRPTPSLLHGDLWSGNALPLTGGGVGVVDPAPSVGDALADNGYGKVALRLFNQISPPSFGDLIRRGATTLWEYWGETEVDQAEGPRSLSHPMFGGFDTWFFQGIAGICPDPQHPGFRHVLLKPQFIEGLEYAKTTYHSLQGTFDP